MSLYVDVEKRLGDFHLKIQFETQGGVLGLLGASGCGKSYTLKCIAGIETPDRGKIVLDGVTLYDSAARIDLKPQKRQVGYLFQHYALFPNMTVRQNILCALRGEKDRARWQAALEAMLDVMQLRGLENHRPHQLSGGQAQRAALARIWVSKPRLLMLDEPFSALDSHLREKLQIQMQEMLAQFPGETLMVTHSRDEAYRLCRRIGVMEEGRLLAVKDTKALFADPGTSCAAALTGCKNIAPAVKRGSHQVEVPQWGLSLTTAKAVEDGITAVGIRAHYFNPKTPSNMNRVAFTGVMEEPFETTYCFRWANQQPGTEDLWWRVPKDRVGGGLPQELGIAPANVLLLYDNPAGA